MAEICSSGQVACGTVGCMESARCCNGDANWACATGNACYTASGTVDCYATVSAEPVIARSCGDYSNTACSAPLCTRCSDTTAPICYLQVWDSLTVVGCWTSSTTWFIPTTTTRSSTSSISSASRTRITSDPTTTSRSTSAFVSPGSITSAPVTSPTISRGGAGIGSNNDPTSTPAPDSDSGSSLSGGAIAGIAIGAFAAIAIIGILAFFLWRKQKPAPPVAPVASTYPDATQYQPPYSPPPNLYDQQAYNQGMTQPYNPNMQQPYDPSMQQPYNPNIQQQAYNPNYPQQQYPQQPYPGDGVPVNTSYQTGAYGQTVKPASPRPSPAELMS